MACNFLRLFLLECFGSEQNNPNGNGNMCGFRWLISCFGADPESLETSIQGSGGNMFGKYYWQSRLSMAGAQANLQIEDHSHLVSGGETESSEISIQGSSGNTFSQLGLARHLYGMFSMAGVGPPTDIPKKDRSQLVSETLTEQEGGPRGVFVGIYDGHSGSTCSLFHLNHLFTNFKSAIANHNGVNLEAIKEAYQTTEESFVNYVKSNWHDNPHLAVLGSCCLVGVVFNKVLHVANAGESHAVLARWPDGGGLDDMEVIQLSVELRDEVSEEHSPGFSLFEEFEGCSYVRGSIPAMGHAYLKYDEFNQAPLHDEYIQKEPIVRPLLTAEPMIQSRQLGPDDRFVIFASDGLWNQMNKEEAASLVRNAPRDGAAGMLLKEAMRKAAARHESVCVNLRSLLPCDKVCYDDDISIVILFFDNL